MDYWLAWFGQRSEHAREIAVAAEELGFKGIAVPDHVAIPVDYRSLHPSGRRAIDHEANYPDPLLTIASMSAVTTRLEFMTYIYVLSMREPFTVAKQVATLSDLCAGRLTFGVGAGWNLEEILLLGQEPATRGQRMDEMLKILSDLWDDGIAEFDGKFYSFGPVGAFPVPAHKIPVWIGGDSSAALRRAASHDGWLGMLQSPEEIKTIAEFIHRERDLGEHQDVYNPLGIGVLADYASSQQDMVAFEGIGVDRVILRAWSTEQPGYESLDEKLKAMRLVAEKYSFTN